MRTLRSPRCAGLAAGAAAAALGVAGAAGAAAPAPPHRPTASVVRPLTGTLPNVDVRTDASPAPVAALLAARARRAFAGARIAISPQTGTARSVVAARGFLTAPVAGSPPVVARRFAAAHAAALGLDATDVAGLFVQSTLRMPWNGITRVDLGQRVGGLEAVGAHLRVWVDARGRVLAAGDAYYHGLRAPGADALGPAGALRRAAGYAGTTAGALARVGTAAGYGVWRGAGTARAEARKVVFPTRDGGRLAYEAIVQAGPTAHYDVVVDASSGALLRRTNLVLAAEGTTLQAWPGAPNGGGTWATRPFPDAWLGGQTTSGNNVDAYADPTFDSFNQVPGPGRYAPASATQQFDFAFPTQWTTTRPVATFVTTPDGTTATVDAPLADRDADTTQLYWFVNTYHDHLYDLGFTEAAGNFQRDDFGKGGAGGDSVQAVAMSGISADAIGNVDNAYFVTTPDGGLPDLKPTAAMFLFAPLRRFFDVTQPLFEGDYADGSLDASVVYHELTHGLTTRLVGGPATANGLNAFQSGAMGEGWSDWFSLSYLDSLGFVDDAHVVEGPYTTGNAATGIRNYRLDANPLNYGDVGYDLGPEVHADGEIWSATLWDLRRALIAALGRAPGIARAERLVFDGLVLSPTNPSFLDERDAILLADRVDAAGADQDLIWQVFARRGMGGTADTNGPDDFTTIPGFDAPTGDVAMQGQVVDAATGAPLRAHVVVGPFETGRPLARTSFDGRFSVPMVDGAYSFVVSSPGYGSVRFDGVHPGVRVFRLHRDLAAAASGAKVVDATSEDPFAPASALIDENASLGWETPFPTNPVPSRCDKIGLTCLPVPLPQAVTIDLGSAQAIGAFRLTPTAPQGFVGNDSGAKDVSVLASTDGTSFAVVGAFHLPGAEKPRTPISALTTRTLTLAAPVTARYLRVRIDSTRTQRPTTTGIAEFGAFAP